MTNPESEEEEDAEKQSPIATMDVEVTNNTSRSFSRSLSHISENSADGVMLMDRLAGESGEVMSLVSGISINDIEMEMPNRTPEPPSSVATDTNVSPRRLGVAEENTTVVDVTDSDRQQPIKEQQETPITVLTSTTAQTERVDSDTQQVDTQPQLESSTLAESGDVTYMAHRVSVEEEGAGADCLSMEGNRPVDSGLEDALGAVVSSLDDYRGQFPELQLLEQELKLLQVTLKVRTEHV